LLLGRIFPNLAETEVEDNYIGGSNPASVVVVPAEIGFLKNQNGGW